MKYLSLFSGIEAATQAWHPLGWEPVAFSEIEDFPNAVLEHHYPDVPNLGDVTKITENKIKKLGQIDLVVFGSPCQDLSVAGKRKGLDGERSGLFTNAIKIIKWARKHCGCRYALWKNVPGAFSSNGGKDFGEVIKLLSGSEFRQEKYQTAGVAIGKEGLVEWRTLDAQHFGVPQRRRRIFALADFGEWESRGPILFERESLFGDLAESRETRKETTTDVRGCLASGSDTPRVAGTLDTECGGSKLTHQSVANGHIITHPQDSTSGTLTARMMNALGVRDVEEGAVMPVTVWQPNLSAPLSARDYKGPGTDGINEETTNNMVVYENHPQDSRVKEMGETCQTVSSHWGTGGGSVPFVQKNYTEVTTEVEVRKYDVDVPKLQELLKSHRTMTMSQIAESLNIKQTTVEHWFRTDSCFSIPDPEHWLPLKKLLNITDDSLDESIMTFITKDNVYDKTNRIYDDSSQSPTLTHANTGKDVFALSKEPLPFDTTSVTSPTNGSNPKYGDPCHTLGSQQHPPAIALQGGGETSQNSQGSGWNEDVSFTLNSVDKHAVAFSSNMSMPDARTDGKTPTLKVGSGGTGNPPAVAYGVAPSLTTNDPSRSPQASEVTQQIASVFQASMQVRRLTPKECERLQGFPDDYTKIPYRKKDADDCPDGPRYKALGNSMAVPVMRWIGERINQAD